jgi:hypothetical protein
VRPATRVFPDAGEPASASPLRLSQDGDSKRHRRRLSCGLTAASMVKVSAWCVSRVCPPPAHSAPRRPTPANAPKQTRRQSRELPDGFLSALAIESQVLCQLS